MDFRVSKPARIPDIAHLAGVSTATVDRVLNRRLPVREDTALQVIAAAEALGHREFVLTRLYESA